jgi:SAM-dependent methyltransferase
VDLVTLDRYAGHKPDIVHDLEVLPWPVKDSSCDEVHAYEVLEHLGTLGDAPSFFAHFSEIWRVLKPDGYLAATCPSWRGMWAFGDPSHRRIINAGSLVFLDQQEYHLQVGKTAMSDFRDIYRADFRIHFQHEAGDTFMFVLQAIKPARSFGDK